jgi:hypothetical protein
MTFEAPRNPFSTWSFHINLQIEKFLISNLSYLMSSRLTTWNTFLSIPPSSALLLPLKSQFPIAFWVEKLLQSSSDYTSSLESRARLAGKLSESATWERGRSHLPISHIPRYATYLIFILVMHLLWMPAFTWASTIHPGVVLVIVVRSCTP